MTAIMDAFVGNAFAQNVLVNSYQAVLRIAAIVVVVFVQDSEKFSLEFFSLCNEMWYQSSHYICNQFNSQNNKDDLQIEDLKKIVLIITQIIAKIRLV